MSHIFISYSRRDLTFAQKIVDALAANNLDTWIDWKSIPGGEDWEQEIYRGIEGADAFLFLISPDSVASEMCNKEIARAVKNGKRILPIFIANVDDRGIDGVIKRFLWEEPRKEICRRNFIKCRDGRDDFDRALTEIRTTIHTDYEWLKYHTKLQGKALDWERRKDPKDASRLLRGKELREAEEQLAAVNSQEDPQPTIIQREYALASRRNEERIRRRNAILTSSITVVMLILTTIAWLQKNQAVEQKNVARAGQLSVQSSSARLEKDIDLALLLGVEAVHASNTFDAQNALLLALEWAPRLRTFLPEPSIYSAFSPDGKLMASIGINEGPVSLWSLDESDPFTLLSTFSIDGQNPRRLCFGSNSAVLAITTGNDIELWDTSAPEAPSLMASIKYDSYKLPSIFFDPTRGIFAIGHRDGQLDLYDVSDPNDPDLISSIALDLNGEPFFNLNQIAYSPNGQVLAANLDDWIVLVDVSNPAAPEEISQVSTTNYGASNISINSDGKFLVLADDGGGMNLIDISNPLLPNLVGDFFGGSDNYGGEGAGGITAVFSSQEPSVLASASCTNLEFGVVGICLESDVFLWEISPYRDPDQFSDPLGGHNGNISEIAFQPGKEFLTVIDSGARLSYWDVSDANVIPPFATLFQLHDASISGMAVSSDNSLFVSGDELGTIIIWNISEPDHPVVLSKLFVEAPPSHLTISPTKEYLAVVSGKKFSLWNISEPTTPALFVEYSNEHVVDILDLVYSPKETQFYSISQDGMINSWSISNSSAYLTKKTTIYQFPEITATAMSPDGVILALGHDNGSLSLWKMPDLSLLKWFDDPYASDYGDSVNGLIFSMDGKSLIASYEFMNAVYFWDNSAPPTIQQPQGALEGSQPGVTPGMFGITMAAKKGLLATRGCSEETGEGDCSDTEVRLWDLSTMSSPRPLGNPLPGSGTKMVMSPNGNLLISDRSDGAIVFWHLDAAYWIKTACQIVARNFTQAEWTKYFPGEEYRLSCPQWPAGE